MSEWISIKDKLPPTKGHYLVYYNTGYPKFGIDQYDDDLKTFCFSGNRIVTHWQPLPQPPKEVSNE